MAIAAMGVSSLATSSCTDASAAKASGGRGTVEVLYAASLLRLMDQTLGPSFSQGSGYRFSGVAGGSVELAHEVAGGLRRGDVFLSASPAADAVLVGAAGGRIVSWYVVFARAPLVLGYDPRSAFAAALRREPWYRVVTSPGFRLGRTDPELDPKGRLTVTAINQAIATTGDGRLRAIVASPGDVFAEETLLGRLETGQLDAAFLYTDEAKAAGIPVLSLSPVSLSTTLTVTVLDRAPHERGALAFVKFLLGPEARRAFRSVGLVLVDPPRLYGHDATSGLAAALGR